jgi:hypothetical protein
MEKIKIIDGCYHAYNTAKEEYEKISNFTIKIKYILHHKGEWKRQIILISDDTETYPFTLESKEMAAAVAFKTLCLKKGDFFFEGKTNDLDEIWKMELSKNKSLQEVYLIDGVGYIKSHNTWLFKNLAIKDREIISPDENKIFWLEDGYGLKVLPLSYGQQLPKLKKPGKGYDLSGQLKLAEGMLNKNLGGFKGSLLIGYVVATIYSRDFYRRYHCFPILFSYGKYQSGKNVFCGLLMNFFGLGQNFATSAQENTQTGVSRLLNYYSYLPIWIDEYRNSDKIIGAGGFFRNVYNKVGSTKAKKEEYGNRDVKIKGNLILSGEEMPIDNALRSRCVPVILTSKERDDSLYNKVLKLSSNFSKITFLLIKKSGSESAKKFLRIADEIKETFVSENIKPREAENFAAIIAGRKFLDKYLPYDDSFEKWMLSLVKTESKRREEESPVVVFWETIEGLISKRVVTKSGHILLDRKEGKIYFWFAELYRAYEKDIRIRKNTTIRSRQAILDQMSEEPYFIKKNKVKRINGTLRTCIVLDYEKCPKNIKEIAK